MATKGRKKLSLIVGLISSLLACFVLTGCASQSTLTINRPILGLFGDNEPNDVNTPILQATGQAASTLAAQIANNMQTAQGRLAETMKFNAWAYLLLIGIFVGGLIIWGYTRSRTGWVVPASAVCGMGLITAFAEHVRLINAGILIIVAAWVIWKIIEYHQERDAERAKLTAEKQKNGSGQEA